MAQAVLGALAVVRDVRAKHGIDRQSPINVVLSDGRALVATRYTFDYGWYLEDESFFAGEREFDFTTLWYTAGGGYEQIDGEWQMAPAERASSILVGLRAAHARQLHLAPDARVHDARRAAGRRWRRARHRPARGGAVSRRTVAVAAGRRLHGAVS